MLLFLRSFVLLWKFQRNSTPGSLMSIFQEHAYSFPCGQSKMQENCDYSYKLLHMLTFKTLSDKLFDFSVFSFFFSVFSSDTLIFTTLISQPQTFYVLAGTAPLALGSISTSLSFWMPLKSHFNNIWKS